MLATVGLRHCHLPSQGLHNRVLCFPITGVSAEGVGVCFKKKV
jgi:hypothetical protein